eukprot:Skav211593  [mRNA]  locus=scaffold2962:54861:62463:- [translate_table: standard]
MRGSNARAFDDFTNKVKGIGRNTNANGPDEDPEAQNGQTVQSSSSKWFSKFNSLLPSSMAEAAAAAGAGDLNALSKAASNAQQGFQQGITDFTGKAKGIARQASTTISENAISKERQMEMPCRSWPMIVLVPQKFALLYTLGRALRPVVTCSLCFLGSFSVLRGHSAFLRHLLSRSRLIFTATYGLSMVGTLWASLIYRSVRLREPWDL